MAIIRQYYDTNRKPMRDIIPLPGPLSCVFEITRMCNLKCFYCVHSTRGIPGGAFEHTGIPSKHMDEDLYDKLVHDIMDFPEPPKKINYAGLGEPLMNPMLGEMIIKLRESGYKNRINIITNGILLTPERSSELVNTGISCIQISIQGLSKESYIENCGVSIDMDSFMSNLKHLFKISRNKTEIVVKIIDSSLKTPEEEECYYKMFDDVCDSMSIEHLMSGQRITKDFQYTEYVDKTLTVHRIKINEPFKACSMLFYQLMSNVDGDIFPCVNSGLPSDMIIGNVKNQSLKDMWYKNKHMALLKQNLAYGYKTISMCADCGCVGSTNTFNENVDDCTEELLTRLEEMDNV